MHFHFLKSRREEILAVMLLVNTFTWFLIGQGIVVKAKDFFGEFSLVGISLILVFPASVLLAALATSVFASSFSRRKILVTWLILGTISSILSGFIFEDPLLALIITSFVGFSLGFGLPSCFAYFSDVTRIEKRGKLGGITFLLVTLVVALTIIATSDAGIAVNTAFFTLWRAWMIPFLLLVAKDYHHPTLRTDSTPFKRIFGERTFVLYFVAWLMFSLVDSFGGLGLNPHITRDFKDLMAMIEPLIAGVSAVVGGVISDWGGRKKVVIFGFISLGVAYGIIGLIRIPISWIFYFLVDGIALGLLWVIFVVVIWGDLAERGREKYYSIGLAPFFLSQMARSFFSSYEKLIPVTSIFSLAAFFLFIAVIPLLYAKETLPEKKIFEHQVRSYSRDALTLKERVAER